MNLTQTKTTTEVSYHRSTLCDNCQKDNMTCPVYPLETQKCVEYVPIFGPKPRLKMIKGCWVCMTPPPNYNKGIGLDPYAAYIDWQYR